MAANPNITLLRRTNFNRILNDFIATQAMAGVSLRSGLEQAFAAKLQVHRTLIPQWKHQRPISDKSARMIESRTGKEHGWLDQDHQEFGTQSAFDPDQEAQVALVREIWNGGDACVRKSLGAALLKIRDEMKPR